MERSEMLERLRSKIADHLVDISDILGPKYKLTLIARHPDGRSKTIILSDDEYALASEELLHVDELTEQVG